MSASIIAYGHLLILGNQSLHALKQKYPLVDIHYHQDSGTILITPKTNI